VLYLTALQLDFSRPKIQMKKIQFDNRTKGGIIEQLKLVGRSHLNCQFQKTLSPDFKSPCHQLYEASQEEEWRRIFLDRFSKVVVTDFNFNVV
jgi:hypothetical protein